MRQVRGRAVSGMIASRTAETAWRTRGYGDGTAGRPKAELKGRSAAERGAYLDGWRRGDASRRARSAA